MKTKYNTYTWLITITGSAALLAGAGMLAAARSPSEATQPTAQASRGLVAHEWGTFTSVQGGDGELVKWRPLESSSLPKFVYDRQKTGLNRLDGGIIRKGDMLTLQRLETPVIYFYSDQAQTVDVGVKFPQGRITEWYPQASQIGSARIRPGGAWANANSLPGSANDSGVMFACFTPNALTAETGARWTKVKILPAHETRDLMIPLPFDTNGSNYFSARETAANIVQVDPTGGASGSPEHEKFIFYRGTGNFATPLRVTMNSGTAITMANTGAEPLGHLFVLGLERGAGKFVKIDRLAPGESRSVELDLSIAPGSLQEVSGKLGKSMEASLVSEGLYAPEAAAMVKTWKESWLEEDGLRVLYVLPSAWTDRTLPLTINPAPREIVRVMVGRAEVLAPKFEARLAGAIQKANQGDGVARTEARQQIQKLGRFAEPAVSLAIKDAKADVTDTAWKIYQEATSEPKAQVLSQTPAAPAPSPISFRPSAGIADSAILDLNLDCGSPRQLR